MTDNTVNNMYIQNLEEEKQTTDLASQFWMYNKRRLRRGFIPKNYRFTARVMRALFPKPKNNEE